MWKWPRVHIRSGKQGVSTGPWSRPQGGGTKQGLQWAEGLPRRGQGAAGRRTATWAGLRNPARPMTHASPGPDGAAVPRPPRGHRGAAYRSNSSWRTNNLTHWSAGGSQAGEHPWQHLPGPALPCPQGQPAASQGRGSSSEAEAWGCPGGRAPSASPVSPRDPPGASSPLAALRAGGSGVVGRAGSSTVSAACATRGDAGGCRGTARR